MSQANKSRSLDRMVRGAATDAQASKKSQRKPQFVMTEVARQIQKQISTNGRTIQAIPIKLIDLGQNIRNTYDPVALKQLATSIEKDGLIQFPTLALKKVPSGYRLVCRNGHRRIMASELLGWEKVECIILPFESVQQELYHSLNANLRENVFYLDIAEAYEEAHRLGESDQEIAGRVGLNQRTVRWYRRLSEMSQACKDLIRANPDLFNATWAVKLSRLGPLPPHKVLEKWLKRMIKEGKTFIKEPDEQGIKAASQTVRAEVLTDLKKEFRGKEGVESARWAHYFLNKLAEGGYFSKTFVSKIEYDLFGEKLTDSLYAESQEE